MSTYTVTFQRMGRPDTRRTEDVKAYSQSHAYARARDARKADEIVVSVEHGHGVIL